MHQAFAFVAVLTKTHELFSAHMVTRKEMRDKCGRLSDIKLAWASCDGTPSNSKPLTSSILGCSVKSRSINKYSPSGWPCEGLMVRIVTVKCTS